MVANKATTASTHLVKLHRNSIPFTCSVTACVSKGGRVDSKKTLHEQNPPVINAG